MNKFILATIITVLLFTLVPTATLAQENRSMDKNSSISDRQQHKSDTRLENLKTRAQKEIDRRITSLTNLNNRMSEIKRLTDEQKSTFSNNIQTQINDLNALKIKIDENTESDTLRSDVKSIVTSYRIYALYMPQIHVILASNSILNTADKFTSLGTKLQTRISEAQAAGNDVSALQTTYEDFQTKVSDAQTQANNAIEAVSTLQPEEYPGNKTTLQSARKMLQTARLDLKTARQDAQTIIQGLRELEKDNSNPSSSTSAQ